MYDWEPHIPRAPRLRVDETSCCGEYELASEGGEYFVLRWTGDGEKQEETARGVFARAYAVWHDLAAGHQHKSRAS
ncbi:hypothetical protein ACFLIM_39315 [Nonomuraea sp. M3C6]|uniref:Uncharacterized protein n=1 Tax=Nonomuraea marmarensis TaxID=3351344 RepID=A0ABW7AQ93_9ACTN